MAETQTRLRFGYNPGLPEGCDTAWGARAITTQRCMDFLWDRQGRFGPRIAELVAALNGGLLKKAQDRYRYLVSEGVIDPAIPTEVTLLDEGGVRMLGNTNGSHGYIYVCAFFTD